ncbi:MAG: hypothetical protein Q7U58_13605, partial [Hydrogenophaga sp.]|nr:hypothetical protein [Hydrogenophaga sp.]
EMNLRARGLAPRVEETEVKAKPARSPKVIDEAPKTEAAAKPAAKKAAAPKAETTESKAAPAKKAPAKKADKAGDEA